MAAATKQLPTDPKIRPAETINRRAPPVPPTPKRAGGEGKPVAPPLPTHRRSKSEGKTPFGEEILWAADSKPPFQKKLSSPLGKEDVKEEEKPIPPPRPLKPGSMRVASSTPMLANGEVKSSK